MLGAAGAKTDAVWLTVPAAINSLGGSENWISADGRLITVSYGGNPAVHVFDTQNLAAGPFVGAIPQGSSTGYAAMLPSGRFVVTTSGTGYLGNGATTTFYSYAINLASRSISTTGNAFWNLCGDHGAFISPSDGHDYLITTSCYNVNNVMRVDLTGSVGTETAQIAANKILLPNLSWAYSIHATAVAKGAMRDWAFIDTEGGGSTPSSWAPNQMEIIGFNVVTGEKRRLAHHRSTVGDYTAQPRISASWGGELIGFASNFQHSAVDIYALSFSGGGGTSGDTTAPTVSVTSPAAGSTDSGTVMVSATAADAVGVVGVQFMLDGANLGAESMSAPYQTNWATTLPLSMS